MRDMAHYDGKMIRDLDKKSWLSGLGQGFFNDYNDAVQASNLEIKSSGKSGPDLDKELLVAELELRQRHIAQLITKIRNACETAPISKGF